jgi:hypothetical protein
MCNFLGIGDFETLLFVLAYFYSQFAEERASTLVHESCIGTGLGTTIRATGWGS